ncbi:hypothetical protein ACFQ9J_13850 [Streptomyces sp. NPDC056529]|uniref:hypothetical protein n=1 Tax=Streptomyces sp. NPDC056529 TaxID=3345855 RepID=UPI0036B608DC
MNVTITSAAPIYDLLIAERGDVVADAARIAEQTRAEATGLLDFGLLDRDRDGEADADAA